MEVQLAIAAASIKVTFTLKDLSDYFYDGHKSMEMIGLNNMSDREKFTYLVKKSQDMARNVKQKVGNGQFNDKVTLNQLMRNENVSLQYTLADRKGYKLATFIVG